MAIISKEEKFEILNFCLSLCVCLGYEEKLCVELLPPHVCSVRCAPAPGMEKSRSPTRTVFEGKRFLLSACAPVLWVSNVSFCLGLAKEIRVLLLFKIPMTIERSYFVYGQWLGRGNASVNLNALNVFLAILQFVTLHLKISSWSHILYFYTTKATSKHQMFGSLTNCIQ